MDNYRSDLDRDDREQVKEDMYCYRNNMSHDDKHREDRARHMINPKNAEQQRRDIAFNHSLKMDPLSSNDYY